MAGTVELSQDGTLHIKAFNNNERLLWNVTSKLKEARCIYNNAEKFIQPK